MEGFDGWADYPMNLRSYSSISTNGEQLKTRLADLSVGERPLFSSEINISIIDIIESQSTTNLIPRTCFANTYTTAAKVEAKITEPTDSQTRIISIHSKRTVSPIQITAELMRKILTRYQVDPCFLPILFSFGDGPHLAEGSSSNLFIKSSYGGETKIAYQLRYIEENQRLGADPWSLRHIGVYHHHCAGLDLWILLQSVQNSAVEQRLLGLQTRHAACESELRTQRNALEEILKHPFSLHVLLFNSYIDNWRWYFRYLGDRFETENDKALSLDRKSATTTSLSFRIVQSLRNSYDIILSSRAHCSSNLDILQGLFEHCAAHFGTSNNIEFLKTKCRGYVDSLDVLQGRIRSTIDLIAYTLNLVNQDSALKTNQHLFDLTLDTVDDSATVRIITLVSAFYLPGSFVGTLYGMNFFVFDPASQKIIIARDFWVFVATWLPLTILTAAIYGVTVLFSVRAKGKHFPWPWRQSRKSIQGP